MRAVRVGQIAGHVDLLRLHALDQLANDPHVFVADRLLGDRAGAIERQIEKVQMLLAAAAHDRAGLGLAPANQRLDRQHRRRCRARPAPCAPATWLTCASTSCERSMSMPNRRLNSATRSAIALRVVIEHGDVAAGHVGHVDFVLDPRPAGSACPPMLITSSSGCGLKQITRFGSRPAG